MACQCHRPDLDKGMILAFRRPQSPYLTDEPRLHGLRPDASYELKSDTTGEVARATGAQLMAGYQITIPRRRGSEVIVYRKL